jgi:hypothetical protein
VIPTSKLFRESMAYSRTMFTELDIVRDGVVVAADIPVVDGTVTTDRGSNTRYAASATLAMYSWDIASTQLAIDGTRVRIRMGVTSIGIKESVQVGEYLAFDYTNGYKGALSIELKGLEQLVIDDRFIRPRTPPYGASTVDTISNLIRESVPDAQIVALNSLDKMVTDTAAWDKERWDTITGLAKSIHAEVFCGYDGRWYIVDAPDLTNLVPVFSVVAGEAGVLIEESFGESREGVYNAWSVSGQSSDANVPPCWGFAADTTPGSPTHYGGRFGKITGFYSSQFFTQDAQCLAYAQRLLAESLAYKATMTLSAGPLPLLEASDPVATSDPEGAHLKTYLLQQTTLPLGTGAWNATCLTSEPPEGG